MNEKQKKDDYLHALRHTAEHVLMAAMKKIWGDKIVMAMGPATDEGFYFDFDSPDDFTVSEDDFNRIEAEMEQLIEADLSLVRKEVSLDQAREMFQDNPYKQEWLEGIEEEGEQATVYYLGDPDKNEDIFVDLCRGPHVDSTGEIKAFKLLSIAGAYWHGDEENKMLTRIYGTAFPSQKELDEFLEKMEEARRRDHRKIGQELDLFTFDQEVGQGLPLWLPNGAWLRKKVVDYAYNTYLESGYLPVSTPHIASDELWQHSGHVDFYKEGLYGEFEVEEEKYRLKPMNCPFHVAIYNNKQHSYRDLPIRYAEMGTVYRYERSGVLHGLTRVRGFTQDDAHIICTPEQLKEEVKKAFKLTLDIFKTFGFEDFEVNLSVRDPNNKEKFIGSDDDWQEAEKVLLQVIEEMGYENDFVKDVGGAVFYGPKIDIKVEDSLGRKWQLSTLQFDFNLPERFDMTYIGQDGEKHTPFMVHRALLGSVERFLGVLIEHYAGKFPVWLAPVQVVALPITENEVDYGREIINKLRVAGFRVELDDSSSTLSKRIRYWEKQKVPYILVLGGREEEAGTVNVRNRDTGEQTEMKISDFIDLVENKISSKDLKV